MIDWDIRRAELGPKEARVEFLSCSLAKIPYFRAGLQGVLLGIGELFTKKIYVVEAPSPAPTTMVFRGSWV